MNAQQQETKEKMARANVQTRDVSEAELLDILQALMTERDALYRVARKDGEAEEYSRAIEEKHQARGLQTAIFLIGQKLKSKPSTASADQTPAIVVTLNTGLDTHDIEHVQLIEKQLDAALLPVGYARSTSSKSGKRVVFNYWQCAVIEQTRG
jgi:hypothetical protein